MGLNTYYIYLQNAIRGKKTPNKTTTAYYTKDVNLKVYMLMAPWDMNPAKNMWKDLMLTDGLHLRWSHLNFYW